MDAISADTREQWGKPMDNSRRALLLLAVLAILLLIGTAVYTGNAAIYLLAALATGPALLVWQRRGADR